jgi:hypothetical protein
MEWGQRERMHVLFPFLAFIPKKRPPFPQGVSYGAAVTVKDWRASGAER